MRAFTGVPQLRKHIMAQVCPVLHGTTVSRKTYEPQPALPAEADTSCTPLKDRATTLQFLRRVDGGNWLNRRVFRR